MLTAGHPGRDQRGGRRRARWAGAHLLPAHAVQALPQQPLGVGRQSGRAGAGGGAGVGLKNLLTYTPERV